VDEKALNISDQHLLDGWGKIQFFLAGHNRLAHDFGRRGFDHRPMFIGHDQV
jgi:hypothetical protein